MTKMTYVNALDIAIATVSDTEAREKLEALKASISKKNSGERKPTATQTENAQFKAVIVAGMEHGKQYTITDLMKSIPEISELSNQRVSAIVRQMVGDTIKREEIKRKAYFSLM